MQSKTGFQILTDVKFSIDCVMTLGIKIARVLKIDLYTERNDVDVPVTRLKMYIRAAKVIVELI